MARAAVRLPSAVTVAAALAVGLLGAPQAAAQETIASDRPGIGSGATVLPRSIFQIEAGAAVEESGGSRFYSLGQFVVRYGLSALELQIFPNSYVIRDQADPGVGRSGVQDLGLGVKVPLAQGGSTPVALQVIGTAATAGDGIPTAGGPTLTANLLTDLPVADRLVVSVNAGVTRVFDDFVGGNSGTLIVTPAVSLDGGVGLYGGWAGFFASGEDSHVLEAGITYLASPDVQLDVNGGWDAREPSSGWFFGVGAARRWGAR